MAGTSLYLQGAGEDASLGSQAGYALLGGNFFPVSALRLGNTAAKN